jgi:hypothetical protein
MSGPWSGMTITCAVQGAETVVGWGQAFGTAAERRRMDRFAVDARRRDLDRLASHVLEVT